MTWEPSLARDLVGRGAQLDLLRNAWTTGGQFVVVTGPAGIGKSRLVRELHAHVRRHTAGILVGRCTQAAVDVPLRPISEALLGAARAGIVPPPEMAAFVPALARLVPEWGSSAGADRSPLVLGEGLLRLVSSLGTEQAAALLVIEDLHWADRETVMLLEFLADGLDYHRLMVVATSRDDLDGPGSELIHRMAASRRARVIKVGPLNVGEVRELARACLDPNEPSEDLIAVLVERSDGNPFVVEELLMASDSPDTEALERALPASVTASTQARLAMLDGGTLRLVRAAALLGRQFDWELAADAAGVTGQIGSDRFGEVRMHSLVEWDGSGYRFRHALTRDAVLADVLPRERADLAAGLLAALQERHPDLGGGRLQLAAELARQAGQQEQACELLVQAARRALADGSLASAAALAEQAALAAGWPANGTRLPAGRPNLRLAFALMAVWTQVGELDRVAALGAELLARTVDPVELVELRTSMATAAANAGHWDEADLHVGCARLLVAGDRAEAIRLDVLAAQIALGRDDAEEAGALARRVLEREVVDGDAVMRCEALEVIGRVARLSDPRAAERAFASALDIARAARLQVWEMRALHELGSVDLYTTLSPVRLEAARAAATSAGAVAIGAVIDLQLAATYGERIELDASVAAARRCQLTSTRFGLPTAAMAFVIEAAAHGRAGRRGELDLAAAAARAVGYDEITVEATLAGLAESSFDLHRGDLVAALSSLERSMVWVRRLNLAGFPFPGLWALLRTVLGASGKDARDEIRALPFDTPMSRATLLVADAVAAGQDGNLVLATEQFGRADDWLSTYERGYRRDLVRWLAARPAAAAGWGEPVVWLRASITGFESLDLAGPAQACRAALRDLGVAVPRKGRGEAVVPQALASLGITGREFDVLIQLGQGCSNREIAERLFLSPRTVEKHVERLAMKTGTDRAGLMRLARTSTD